MLCALFFTYLLFFKNVVLKTFTNPLAHQKKNDSNFRTYAEEELYASI